MTRQNKWISGLVVPVLTALLLLVPGSPSVANDQSSGANAEVTIDNFSFGPQTVTVPVGAMVTWTNHDDIPHTVVSTDGVFSHVAWMEFHIGKLDFPLASDRAQVVSRDYGVLDGNGQSARGVFIIDPDGVVRYEVVHDDRVGRSVDEILRVLTALKAPGRTFAQFDPERALSC